MTLVTQAEFAKHHGVSRKTVTKWKDGDYLVLSSGKVELEKTDAILKEHGLGRFRDVTRSKSGNRETVAKPPEARPSPLPSSPPRTAKVARPSDGYANADPEEDHDLDVFVHDTDRLIEDILAGRNLKVPDAERVKENHLALKHILDMRERAGMLVEMDKAEALFFETTRKARDAWMDWPTTIGPLLAADLGLEADIVVEALTKYVQLHLEKLGDQRTEFGGETRPAGDVIAARLDAAAADQPA